MPRRYKQVVEKKTVKECLEDAASELEGLAEEMREWQGNMEGTNLEYTSKYEVVSEAADTLEDKKSELDDVINNLEGLEPTVDLDKEVEVRYVKPYGRYESRPTRRDRVVAYLEAVKDHLETVVSNLESEKDELEALEEAGMDEEQQEEIERLERNIDDISNIIDDLDNIISDLGDVEFPSMY